MDRRIFLKGVVGGSALGLVPAATWANGAAGGGGGTRMGLLLAQRGIPEALAIARGIATETGARVLEVEAAELGSYRGVSALLDGADGARVIGVMDDASAVIFQQIAAARGAGLAMDTHRRVGTASLVSFAINT